MWPELGTIHVALWGGTLRMQGRFVRGTVLGRDALNKGALLREEPFRVSFSFLKSCEALLMLINGEFLTVGCAFECFLYK